MDGKYFIYDSSLEMYLNIDRDYNISWVDDFNVFECGLDLDEIELLLELCHSMINGSCSRNTNTGFTNEICLNVIDLGIGNIWIIPHDNGRLDYVNCYGFIDG